MRRGSAVVLIVVVAGALIVSVMLRQSPSSAQSAKAAPQVAGPVPKRALIGATSCAASLCHGGSDLGERRSEVATWQALDPHARAYDSLLSADSRKIVAHLKLAEPAHEVPLCLKCHVDPGYENARPSFRKQGAEPSLRILAPARSPEAKVDPPAISTMPLGSK